MRTALFVTVSEEFLFPYARGECYNQREYLQSAEKHIEREDYFGKPLEACEIARCRAVARTCISRAGENCREICLEAEIVY